MADPRLTKLRVLGLEEDERSKMLVARWLMYENRHDDHLGIDWEGYVHEANKTWIQAKFRGRGYVKADDQSIPFGGRRPVCHSTLVGETVDGYTALLLGESRQPSLRFIGDEDSSTAISALFRYADFWPVMSEARKLAGAMGCAAVIPEVLDSQMSLRTLRPEHLYIEWTKKAGWIPEMVIEQRRMTIRRFSERDGKVETVEVWRTRAWDSEFSYAYQDVPVVEERKPGEEDRPTLQDIELSEAPVPHNAGRCPVHWLQNTTNCDGEDGDADCEAIFESIAQLDRSLSMVMRGSRANNDPTLVVSDTMSARTQWPKRKKGYGRSLELSEKGKAELLETEGRAIESSWASIQKLEQRARARVGLTSPNADNSGAYQSGVALQILHRTETSRAGERRNPLGVTISQLAQTVWTICKAMGIRTYGQAPTEGAVIELPPREVPRQPGQGDGVELEDHELGDGGVVALTWPKLHEPIPEELRTVIDALAKAVAAKIMSSETAVEYVLKVMQAGHDVADELERILGEREQVVGEFDEAMMPDVDEPELDPGAVDGDVAREAMNGIQIKEFGNTFARAGQDLAPDTAAIVLAEAFPGVPDERIASGIREQVQFAEDKAANAPPPPQDLAEQAEAAVEPDAMPDVEA